MSTGAGLNTDPEDITREWRPGDPVTRELSLTRDPDGPFRTEAGPCGADAKSLLREYGLPGDLVKDVLAWWSDNQHRPTPIPPSWDYDDREREHNLWVRLRAVVRSGVFVQPADFVPYPVLVRMFVDWGGLGLGLWSGDVGWPPRPSFDRDTLPITDDLRTRLQDWEDHDEVPVSVGREEWDRRGLEHDRRGHGLSRELQAQLGPGFQVQFSTKTRAGRLEGLDDRNPLTESDT